MAATEAGTQLTLQHRQQLVGLRAETLREVLSLWLMLDLENLDATELEWLRATAPVVLQGRQQAVDVASGYVREFSTAETGLAVDAVAPPPLDSQRLRARLLGAGPWTFKQKIGQGRTVTEAQAETLVRLAGEVTRTVVGGSRDTVLETAQAKSYRWQRITDGDPCAFCALLASRGAVYRTSSSGGFQAHRSCACTAELVMRNSGFRTDESKRWGELYDQSIREARDAGELARGTSNDLLNAFRRAYEAQR